MDTENFLKIRMQLPKNQVKYNIHIWNNINLGRMTSSRILKTYKRTKNMQQLSLKYQQMKMLSNSKSTRNATYYENTNNNSNNCPKIKKQKLKLPFGYFSKTNKSSPENNILKETRNILYHAVY